MLSITYFASEGICGFDRLRNSFLFISGAVFDCSVVYCMNRDELGRFVANKRGLTSLKMEGCSNLGGFSLSSSSLSTLWLSDLHSLSKMVNEFSPLFSSAIALEEKSFI